MLSGHPETAVPHGSPCLRVSWCALATALVVAAVVCAGLPLCEQYAVIVAAGVALPGLPPLLDSHTCDGERGERVGPPPAQEGIGTQSDEQRAGQIGAEHVLLPLTLGRRRAHPVPHPRLRPGPQRHLPGGP